MTANPGAIRCHYEVLDVPRDADVSVIKKSYRKLALKYHPDKNDNSEQAIEQFRLVQQAYECLSEPKERQWYDDHRDAILKGWKNQGGDDMEDDMLFNVVPFMHASCYQGFEKNNMNSFYAVYERVFAEIYDAELTGSRSNPFDDLNLIRDFGNPDTSWDEVTRFYQTWESFASALSFAWVDPYNSNADAPNRRVRRAMDDENQKHRRAAKRARNDEIKALVQFVKRRDPRVRAKKDYQEQTKRQREEVQKLQLKERQAKAQIARDEWKAQVEADMAEAEEEDRRQGRVRLADLDDDYDYGGKKGKKGKKKKNKKKQSKYDEEPEQEQEMTDDPISDAGNPSAEGGKGEPSDGEAPVEFDHGNEEPPSADTAEVDSYDDDEEEETESEEETWRCECCKKDFKSEGQLNNHMQSKKHKAAWKKYQGKLSQIEQEIMDDILNDQQ